MQVLCDGFGVPNFTRACNIFCSVGVSNPSSTITKSASGADGSLTLKNSGGRTCLIIAAAKGLRQKMMTVSCCSAIRLGLRLLRFIAFTPLATEGVCTPRDEAFGYILAGLFLSSSCKCVMKPFMPLALDNEGQGTRGKGQEIYLMTEFDKRRIHLAFWEGKP